MSVDQIASLFEKNISRNEKTRKVVKDHSQIRNAFIFDEKFIFSKERKSIDHYIILLFEIPATAINFGGNDRDSISLSL